MDLIGRRKQDIPVTFDRRIPVETEKFFEKLMNQLSVIIAICSNDKIVYANDIFFQILGYKREELDKISVVNLLSYHQKEILVDRMKRRLDGDVTLPDHYKDIEILKSNGEKIVTTVYPNLIFFKGQLCTLYAGLDFTGQKRNEKVLNQFFEYCPTAAFIKDMQGRLIKVSPHYEKIIGKPMLDIISKSTFELFPKEMATTLVKEDEFVDISKKPIMVEETINGRTYLKTKFPINGMYIGGFALDITEKIQTQKMLEEEHCRCQEIYQILASTLDTMDEMIWICDKKGEIIYQNKALKDEPNVIDLIGHEEMSNLVDTKKKFLKSYNNDYEESYFEITKTPILNDNGDIIGCCGKIQDVTLRVQKENRLLEKIELFQKENELNMQALVNLNNTINTLNNPIRRMGVHRW